MDRLRLSSTVRRSGSGALRLQSALHLHELLLVEASSTLAPGSWTVNATTPGTVGQSVTVADTFDLPTATPPRRFLRLRVTTP